MTTPTSPVSPTATATPDLTALAVGDIVASTSLTFDRARLIRYAGASGDFNRIHWDQAFAQGVGLDNVIVHGMLTMGAAVSIVEEWAGDPGRVIDYQTRFTRPIPVPASGDVPVEVTATVGAIDAEARTTRIDLTVTHDGNKVLAKSQAQVRL